MRKFLIIMVLAISLLIHSSAITYAKGPENATWANAIFVLLGHDRPEQWGLWDRDTKHAYLSSLGIHSDERGKYRGRAWDIAPYFQIIGKDQPADWYEMTFEERKSYVNSAEEMTPPVENNEPVEQEENETQSEL